eukprot:gene3424-3696_t
MEKALAKLSRSSKQLDKPSRALDKASIVSIAKNTSIQSSSVDVHVHLSGADETPWHAIPDAQEVVDELVSNASNGLSAPEAARRVHEYGPNQLTPPDKPGFLRRLWNQLNNILIFILFCAAVVEGALQSWAEFGLVFAVIIINAAIGLIQEGKAEKAAEAIKAMLSPNAQVLRNGEQQTIPAEDLVPGDMVLLKSGDKVPADLRLIQATNLQVIEQLGHREYCRIRSFDGKSSFDIGESVPVSKDLRPAPPSAGLGDRKCMAFSATAVTSGQAVGIVVATGDSAEVGQISKMVNTVTNVKNNLIHQLDILGRWLAVMVAFIALISFLLALLHARQSFKTAFESAVSIAVAIIPEGLPAMVTIVLAIGTTVMAKNNVNSQLGCSKTKNEMTVVMLRTSGEFFKLSGVGYAPSGTITTKDDAPLSDSSMANVKKLLGGAVLCNDSALSKVVEEASGRTVYQPQGAPTEVALLTAGEKLGLRQKELRAVAPRLASVPFESEHKFMATVHQEEGSKRVLYVKGAPDRLLPMCCLQLQQDVDSLERNSAGVQVLDVRSWQSAQAEMSKQGLRVLALCRAELPESFDLEVLSPGYLQSCQPFLTMLLMVAILDPPRTEVVEAIKVAHQAGITVKMITGDHGLTALAIGNMLGIAGNGMVFSGPDMDRINDDALQKIVKDCNVFARASPENKLRIVRALQVLRQTVAMTGDGVNDAPALKAADVGVAMGITGTDVSKEAAKMVLADDNFASIVAAVREGRRVWDNIRKILVFNLPVNLAQGTSVLYSYVLSMPATPLTALQVLLVNLVTSVTLGLALAAEPAEPTVMTRPPRRAGKRLVGKLLLWRVLFVCHLVVVLVLGMFAWGGREGRSLGQRRAEAFNVLVGAQVVYFINCRFLKLSTLHPRLLKGNKVAPFSVVTTLCLMWGRVAVCMAIIYLTVEAEKALVDPVLMPMIRPVLRALENITPAWLSADQPLAARLIPRACRKMPRTMSGRIEQRRGRKMGGAGGQPARGAAAGRGDQTGDGGDGIDKQQGSLDIVLGCIIVGSSILGLAQHAAYVALPFRRVVAYMRVLWP